MSSRASVLVLVLALACSEGPSPQHAAPAPAHHVTSPPEAPPAREVTFTTSDGVTIAGTLQRGTRADAPAIVLVHQLDSTRAEWAPLLERLRAEPSFTTLAIDMRGHGASTHGPNGTLDWHTFDADAWAATRRDVIAAVAFLTGADSGAAPASIGAVGSSIGSSAVIAAAAEEPRITTLVTLSPGRAYHGFDAITPAMQLMDRSILAIASADETSSVDTAQAYGRLSGMAPRIVAGDAHGVVLFGVDPAALDETEDFLREHLAWVRIAPRSSAPPPPPPVTSPGTPAPPG
jgi:pimeloyl-ACP methyl ester carboxylesterase